MEIVLPSNSPDSDKLCSFGGVRGYAAGNLEAEVISFLALLDISS